jgi:hypothetical protein
VHPDRSSTKGTNAAIRDDSVNTCRLDNRLQMIIADAGRTHDYSPGHTIQLDQRDRGCELVVSREEHAAIRERAAVSAQATASQ